MIEGEENMKTLILIALLMFVSFNIAPKQNFPEYEFHFKNTNVIGVTGMFDVNMEKKFALKVMNNKHPRLYVYIDSSGGYLSVVSNMLEIMDAYKGKTRFVCIARRAYSAAFIFFQNCSVRYMSEYGSLMSHDAGGMIMGELSRMEKELRVAKKIYERLSRKTAENMGMPYDEYKQRILGNLWYTFGEAKDAGIIDGKSKSVSCSKRLIDKEYTVTEKKCSIFKCVDEEVSYSACPLIK